ncbi:MAG: CPBP family intramembrane metalloprotease [Ilumatobacteraceae bacterium]|nr:CPBP family intramembrane metalloprotease [Ilumatobacteraceae bacterium]
MERPNVASDASTSSDRQVLWFGLLAIGLTWSAWLPLAATSEGWGDVHASPYLHFVGGLGPALAALIMTAANDGRRGLRVLLQRVTTGPGRWLTFAALAPATGYFIAIGAASAFGVHVGMGLTGASLEFSSTPVAVYWLANLVFYGYGEEIGWRGFALPRLQRHRSALAASMWLALVWGLWHVPLFFFSAGLGTMPPIGLIGWAASIVTGSVVCTWLFNSTRGSLAVLAIFHASLDIFIGSPTGGDVVPNVMGAFVVCGALVIPRRFGRENLSTAPKVI